MYVRPSRNRLPGLRGMGAIDIGPSASVEVTPEGATVTGQGASAGYQQTTTTPPPSITDFLNQNSSTLLWIAGIGIGVMFLARIAR
jgi:hypothetical protein